MEEPMRMEDLWNEYEGSVGTTRQDFVFDRQAECAAAAMSADGVEWCRQALLQPGRRHFVAHIFANGCPLPEPLLEVMLYAACDDGDPSGTQMYVRAALASHSVREVLRLLVHHLETGTSKERSGAANALYWVSFGKFGEHNADAFFNARMAVLRQFLDSVDLSFEQAAIALVTADALGGFEDGDLYRQAIAKAAAHTDPYILARVAVSQDGTALLPCVPPPEPRSPLRDLAQLHALDLVAQLGPGTFLAMDPANQRFVLRIEELRFWGDMSEEDLTEQAKDRLLAPYTQLCAIDPGPGVARWENALLDEERRFFCLIRRFLGVHLLDALPTRDPRPFSAREAARVVHDLAGTVDRLLATKVELPRLDAANIFYYQDHYVLADYGLHRLRTFRDLELGPIIFTRDGRLHGFPRISATVEEAQAELACLYSRLRLAPSDDASVAPGPDWLRSVLASGPFSPAETEALGRAGGCAGQAPFSNCGEFAASLVGIRNGL